MLFKLRRVIEEVNAAGDLQEAMQIVVSQVRKMIATDACSIYLYSTEQQTYYLSASEGFKNDGKYHLVIQRNEGLVGLIGKREEPLNLEHAHQHPNFRYFPETGEEQFRAFLGAPIIHHRKVLGVLVLQQRDSRKFDEDEEAFVVTVSTQLAGVIARTDVIAYLRGIDHRYKRQSSQERLLTGIPVAPGICLGQAVVVYPPSDLDAIPLKTVEAPEKEITLFHHAIEKVKAELTELAQGLSDLVTREELTLFDAYHQMLDQTSLGGDIEAAIYSGLCAQSALKQVVKQYIQTFQAMSDDYLRDRASDVKDLGRRILRQLQQEEKLIQDFPPNTVLIGEEVTAALLAEVPPNCLAGIVSIHGSSHSHAAILAKALGVPVVMGIEGMNLDTVAGQQIVVDGYKGYVTIAPEQHVKEQFIRMIAEKKAFYQRLSHLRDQPSETLDGVKVPLYVNTGLMTEVISIDEREASGVGLYRTEVPFLVRDCFPTEEDQHQLYRTVLAKYAPKPVVMRTLDIGGDKILPYFPVSETNPYLGWRGIRVTLDHPELFLVQIRAMLRANLGLNNLKIMLPMVSHVSEITESIRLIEQAHQELSEELAREISQINTQTGYRFEKPSIGIMIEVPAMAYQIRQIASLVDFLSIGSNDLVQYFLAVDRNNERVANLYDALHPSVIQLLGQIIQDAHHAKLPVTLCGEMASDPAAILVLLALGIDALSVSVTNLLTVKWVIRSFSARRTQELLAATKNLTAAKEIRQFLNRAIEEAGLGGLIRAGH